VNPKLERKYIVLYFIKFLQITHSETNRNLYTPNAGVAYINEKFKILVLHTMCLFKDIMCRVQSNDKSTLIRYLIKLIKYLA